MRVLNIHQRTIRQPKKKVLELFSTLATGNDRIWPVEHWPAIRFREGLKVGSKGGHGPIRYTVEQYDLSGMVLFRFDRPKGANGTHWFEVIEKDDQHTEIRHTISMHTTGITTFTWLVGIRWLHDALLEDALDKVENHFFGTNKKTEWNWWVKLLRSALG